MIESILRAVSICLISSLFILGGIWLLQTIIPLVILFEGFNIIFSYIFLFFLSLWVYMHLPPEIEQTIHQHDSINK
ncbi:MAG: hypothetical protein ACFFCQ_04465 [Promethearchaeota archaeon]